MPTKKTRVKEVTTHLVHLVGAVSLQDGDLVGELLAEWAVSSPHARRQFAVAVRLAQPRGNVSVPGTHRTRAGHAPGIFCDPCPTGGLLLLICWAILYGFAL